MFLTHIAMFIII